MVTREDINFKSEIIEGETIDKIREKCNDGIILWVHSSAQDENNNTKCRCVLDFKKATKYMEYDYTDKTVNQSMITAAIESLNCITKPYRLFIVTPTPLGFSSAFKGKGTNATMVCDLLTVAKEKSTGLTEIIYKSNKRKLKNFIVSCKKGIDYTKLASRANAIKAATKKEKTTNNVKIEQYKGKVVKIFYKNPTDNWSAFKFKLDSGKSINGNGYISCAEGDRVIIYGKFYEDKKYGLTFSTLSSEPIPEETFDGIEKYLCTFKGIGKKTAKKIVAKFGIKETLKILENEPERLKEAELTDKQINRIKAGISENRQVLDLQKITNGNLTFNQISKIITQYGKESLNKLKENPYQIIYDIDGIGFSKADNIASGMGISKYDDFRLNEGIVYTLKNISDNEGHTFAYMDVLIKKALFILFPPKLSASKISIVSNTYKTQSARDAAYRRAGFTQADYQVLNEYFSDIDLKIFYIQEAINRTEEGGNIIIEDDGDNQRVYWKKMYYAETESARILKEMSKKKPIKVISDLDGMIADFEYRKSHDLGTEFKLEEEQKEAIKTALTKRVSVITGGAGVGKTTIVEAILNIWGDDETICLSAPTGKASQRMTEATGRKATTIHLRLYRGETHDKELAIIDESSMLDIKLAQKTLSLFKNCQIIFIGDVNQLPSVGPGSFFQDICASPTINTVRLTKGHRNQGNIAKNSRRINEGEKENTFTYGNDFQFIEMEKEKIIENILFLYKDLLKKYKPKDIITLCPQKRRGMSCVDECNRSIQALVNPNGSDIEGSKYKIGDRLICMKNDHYKKGELDGEEIIGIFNGDCGEIAGYDEDNQEILFKTDDGREYTYSTKNLEDFDYCYAMTIHKAQGSEYPVVITPFTMESFNLLKRNILYTSVTRSKKQLFLLGERKAINMAIGNTDYNKRNSNLQYLLNE